MAVDLDETRFYVFEDALEDEPGSLFMKIEPDEPYEDDFLNACTVARYYAKNIKKILTFSNEINVEICEEKSARKLIGLTEDGGGYVVICEELDPFTYSCKLVYFEPHEL